LRTGTQTHKSASFGVDVPFLHRARPSWNGMAVWQDHHRRCWIL